MGMQDIKKGQKSWESSGASQSEDKKLSEANHNRGVDPSKSAQRGRVSDKLNSDAAKYKQPSRG